jgi:hypothetical protein
VERPDRNREVLFFPIIDIPGKKNQVFTGYYIMTLMDICFVMDKPTISFYKARVYINKLVLIQLPG